MLGSSADIIPQPEVQRRRIRVHSLANPRSNDALAKLCDTRNALELHYPKTDLTLVDEAPGVADFYARVQSPEPTRRLSVYQV